MRAADAVLRDPGPLSAALTRHGPAARRRRFNRTLGPALSAVVVLGVGCARDAVPLGIWCASLLLPAAALLARDRYAGLGHALSGNYLAAGRGSLTRSRAALSCDGIIGWNLRRSPFQRRAKVLTLTATTAGGRRKYVVQDIGDEQALRLVEGATAGMLAPFLETADRRPGRADVVDTRR
ncbi:PH domain-containing protein [Streptomyces noursei]